MCVAVPGQIKAFLDSEHLLAQCDFLGIEREINVQLLQGQLEIGDYVIVHVGYAIQKLDIEEALQQIEAWKDVQDFQKELNFINSE